MASKTFLLLALAFAVVLLITSEVVASKDVVSNLDGEVDDRGGYNRGEHGGSKGGEHGGYNVGGGRGGHIGGGHEGHGKGGGRGGGKHRGCKYGCSSFEEATDYKQTKN